MSRPAFGTVGPASWGERPAIVVGTGPSLKGFDFARLEGLGHVLAVKQAWLDLPFAEACFGLDIPWQRRSYADLCALAQRMPLYIAIPDQEEIPRVIPGATYVVRARASDFMSEDPRVIESGGNSGFGAVNFAYLKKRGVKKTDSEAARTVVLFGFDYNGPHYCPERYGSDPGRNNRYFTNWAMNFRLVRRQFEARGIRVLNASPQSRVDAFEKVTHEQAMQHLDRLRQP